MTSDAASTSPVQAKKTDAPSQEIHTAQDQDSIFSPTKQELARIFGSKTPTIDLTGILKHLPNVRLLVVDNTTLVEVLSVTDVIAQKAIDFTEKLLAYHPSMVSAVRQCLTSANELNSILENLPETKHDPIPGHEVTSLLQYIPEDDQNKGALLMFGILLAITDDSFVEVAKSWATKVRLDIARFVFRPVRESLRYQIRQKLNMLDIKSADLDVHSLIKPYLDPMAKSGGPQIRQMIERYFVVETLNSEEWSEEGSTVVHNLLRLANNLEVDVTIRDLTIKQLEQEIGFMVSRRESPSADDLRHAQKQLGRMKIDLIMVRRLRQAVSERLHTVRLPLPTL